jgi:archaeosine synthase beta-subunit
MWILSRRPERNALDPLRPWAFFVEDEACPILSEPQGANHESGCPILSEAKGGKHGSLEIVPVATLFLTNRECPWRCLMCDLWKNTLPESVPSGVIPAQIDYALSRLPPVRHIKLYNSGSFFDPRAIPVEDYPAIAVQVSAFDRVIVECHPALIGEKVGEKIGENCFRFREQLSGRLEVAMGLETVHPQIIERLNKRMTTEQFAAAAALLREHDIDLRVFILVKPPFMREEESLHWAQRSLDFAFDCGATAATLIPTRGGNGAMEELARTGDFSPPALATLEAALAYGIGLHRGRVFPGRVFIDLWDLKPSASECPHCFPARIERLRAMNLRQTILDPIACSHSGDKG